jgi:nucleotide-binding universal stress UspA family protein
MNHDQPFIVVGIDSSRAAAEALAWAAREACLRGAVLRVVHAWQLPPGAGVMTPHSHDRDVAAQEALHRTLGLAAGVLTTQASDVDVSVAVPEGPPGPVLVRAAADAELLAVGRHPARPWPGAGSVDRYCVAHSRCPVVAVPPTSHPGGHGQPARQPRHRRERARH